MTDKDGAFKRGKEAECRYTSGLVGRNPGAENLVEDSELVYEDY